MRDDSVPIQVQVGGHWISETAVLRNQLGRCEYAMEEMLKLLNDRSDPDYYEHKALLERIRKPWYQWTKRA